jgi:hypothetical protein
MSGEAARTTMNEVFRTLRQPGETTTTLPSKFASRQADWRSKKTAEKYAPAQAQRPLAGARRKTI